MLFRSFYTFLGKPRDHHLHEHVHESPCEMTGPLLLLAVLAAGCAIGGEDGRLFKMLTHSQPVGVSHGFDGAGHSVSLPGHEAIHAVHSTAGSAALLAAFCGMAIAYLIYGKGVVNPDDITPEVAAQFPGRPKLADVPLQPWARELYNYRRGNQFEPHTRCKPSGGPRQFLTPYGVEFVDLPELQRIYILDLGGPHTYRTILMDAKTHPKNLVPTYYGHSIGHWDGDTLVVDSKG